MPMTADSLAARFEAAQRVAREAGAAALAMFRDPAALRVTAKGRQDFVSQADGAVEAVIAERLGRLFPDDGFLGEENVSNAAARGGGLWVVDPIDGTANFVTGVPVWCLSIGYHLDGTAVLGVVHDPNADELFAARRGAGASLNGRPIRASAAASLTEGTVGIGYSSRIGAEQVLGPLGRLLAAGGMYQRNGSGALNLAYVAAGRLLGYYEGHINSWDCLAGIVLVEEAGGWVNDFLAGDGLRRGNPILAAAPALAQAMREVAGL
jgi:myo-inositol-1(or 4)-monophosphatase